MKKYVVINQELHPDDLDFIVGVFQAEDSSEVERYLEGIGYDVRDFDFREEEITKIG